MLESTFLHEFRLSGGARLTESLILFRKPLQIYDLQANETVYFASMQDAYGYQIGSRTVKDIISAAKVGDMFGCVLDGGRGSGSDGQDYAFSHAPHNGSRDDIYGNGDFAARINAAVKTKNVDEALRVFREMHVKDGKEHSVVVDEYGYATSYIHGGRTSTPIGGTKRGDMVYHNHPGAIGGNFSDTDLITISRIAAKGIVASGREGDYKFTKGTHFKAAEFVKAMKNARPRGKNYDAAVGNWLARNQKRYGYKYSFTKAQA